MKSPFALLTSLVLLAGCGQTGPLYMPKPPNRPAPAPAPAPVRTVEPPAPAAGVTQPASGSNANNTDANTTKPVTTPQQ